MTAFARVVEAGGFTAAAEHLNLSRAMVSRLVQQLEDNLGTRLLNRTTRRLSLTEAGRAYYERCVLLLAELESLDSSVSDLSNEARGTLRLNAPMSFGILHVAPCLPDFLNQHPRSSIELSLNDRLVNLVEEGYDLALRIGNLADSSLVARRLAPVRLVLCASPDYLEAHGTPMHPSELVSHNCLTYSYSSQGRDWRFDGPGGLQTVQVKGNLDANSGDAILTATLAGLGIALQPTFIVGQAIRDGQLVQLMPDWKSPELGLHAVYPHRRHLSTKVRLLIDFFADRFSDSDPYWEVGCR